jgi:lysophospholipase L1-like esterase
LITLFLSLLFIFASLEIALRLAQGNSLLVPAMYVTHPVRRYALRHGFSFRSLGKECSINSLGFRGKEFEITKKRGALRILAVGDSCTFGPGLDLDSTYPSQLAALLRGAYPSREIEVINCGVPGYNIDSEYAFIAHESLALDPDCIILSFIYNDSTINAGISPLDNAHFNTLKDFFRRFYTYEFILSRLYRIKNRLKGLSAPHATYRVQELQLAYSDAYHGWLRTKTIFSLLNDFSKSNAIPIIYVIYPKFENLENDYPYEFYHIAVKDALQGHRYVLDLLPFFLGKQSVSFWVADFDSHPNEHANAIIARAIYDFLQKNGLIKL